MSSLHGFPPLPPEGHVSICELEGKVCHLPFESANVADFTSVVSTYPTINITQDLVHSSAREDARQVFLPIEEKFLKRIVSTWLEQGTVEMLQLAADPDEEGYPMLQVFASYVLKVLGTLNHIQNALSPHLRESGEQLVAAVSQTRAWLHSPVRCMAWHNHCTKIAVAAWDDSVRVFSAATPGLVPVLRSKSQRSVSCIAWRPHSASEIAVGCEAGVLVWHVDPKSVVTRPSASCATFLRRGGHSPVTSLQWNSSGSLLVTAAAADTAMYLWDVDLQDAVPLRRVGGGGISLVLWAPDIHKLFAATSGVVFRVWDTNQWMPERWRVQSGRVRTACWSPCSTVLLFATSDEPLVYALEFRPNMASLNTLFNTDSPNSEQAARVVINLTTVELENGERVGGNIVSMAWDPKGRHLAVLFESSSVVAVFQTDLAPTLQVTPCCFVKGAQGETPNAITFQKNFEPGSCLTIAWSSGRIQYFPLVYQDLRSPVRPLAHLDYLNSSVLEPLQIPDASLVQSFCDSFLSY